MATYYWVGGSGTWDSSSTANWSVSSGGAGGSGPPTNADLAIFDSNSGANATVTVASTAVSLNTTVNKSDINLSLSGNVTLCTTAGLLNFISGTLTLNNYTLTCGRFQSDSTNTRFIAFGTGNITVTTNNTTVIIMSTVTGLSYTGTPAFNCSYSGATGTRTIRIGNTAGGSATTAATVNITAGTDAVNLGGHFNTVDFTGYAGAATSTVAWTTYGNVKISSGMTYSTTSSITFAATSGIQQLTTNGRTLDCPVTQNSPGATLQLQDNLTMGSTRTFILTAGTLDLNNRTLSTGIFNSSNSNVRAIAFGTGNITVTGNATTVFTYGVGTNFSYTGTPTVNLTYAGGTGTRTIGFQTVDSLETKALNFNISAGSDIVSLIGTNGTAKNIDFTGFTGTISIPSAKIIYGNWNSGNATIFTGTSNIRFEATSGTQTISSNGLIWPTNIVFNGVGGTFAFQDALTQDSARSFTLTNGTVQLKDGVTSTVGNFVTSGSNQKFLQSTTPGSQATLSEASGTVNANNLTIRDINATGGAIWNAFVDQGNIDAGNNDGWDFGISPVVGGTEYTYQLRSFTQPRRF